MMGEYTTKTTDADGNDAWESTDGRMFKTRGGAYKASKRLEEEQGSESPQAADPPPDADTPPEAEQIPDEDEGDWTDFDWGDDDQTSEVIPTTLKRLAPAKRGKMTKKELEAQKGTNVALLKVGYKGADLLLTRYKRGVMDDPKAEAVTHTEEDYEWIGGITQDALEHNGIFLASALGPNQVAVIANGYWFGSPVMRINAEAKRSPFTGRVGGAVGRFIELVPFVGKRFKARRLRTEYEVAAAEIREAQNNGNT